MNLKIEKYIEDLESRIDLSVEAELLDAWKAFLEGEWDRGEIFSPRRKRAAPPRIAWPTVTVNQALADPEAMLLQQFAGCSRVLEEGSGAILNIRANYGTGILSSLFGAPVFKMEETMNTLPTTAPLPGGTEAIRRRVDQGPPCLTAGFGEACFEMGRRFTKVLAASPKLSESVFVYHPDLQGPMDICELLWGSDLFIGLVDAPDLAHALLDLVSDTYIRFMREWERGVPPPSGEYSAHWGGLHKGRIMIRDDSAMNLSPEMFDEFIRPYDQRLLKTLGGGGVHFCGRGDHYVDRLPEMDGLHALAMSQPEYNDMECIFKNTVDRGLVLLGLPRKAAEEALRRGRDLRHRVHCPS